MLWARRPGRIGAVDEGLLNSQQMPTDINRQEIKVESERVVLAAVRLPDSNYDRHDPFGELTSLAEQAGAVVVGELEQMRQRPESGTYLGSGKLKELRELCDRLDAKTVIFDHDLSPKQIANIEVATERKVLDRSELILDIFASRATTKQARLQVELAQLEYTYPRLRAMWSHLERIVGRGGIGGVGTRGPGEQQLEIDRRLVQQRKLRLQAELAEIQGRRRREVEKRKGQHFTVGLVGYTNAGKSTLFNTLTAGGAYADDRVFATLMTRTRAWDLGEGVEVMLSDTVGFVRDLPHHLVASFRATLEEATHADLLLVVLDVSEDNAELRYETVSQTLDTIVADFAEDVPEHKRPKRIVLLNKVDRLADNAEVLIWQSKLPGSIAVSALDPERGGSGLGLDELAARIREHVLGTDQRYTITLPLSASKQIHEIETKGEVIDRAYNGQRVTITATIGSNHADMLAASGHTVLDESGTPVVSERDQPNPGWKR